MNQITPWSGSPSPPGCAPCFDPAQLLQCWCDIQATTDIISRIMLDQIQNNPAMAQAMVEAMAKSGAALPLVGVTNGVPAQPGQVGEFIQIVHTGIPVTALVATTTQVAMGVLQPGDWGCVAILQDFAWSPGNLLYLNPTNTPGFSNDMFGVALAGTNTSDLGQANTIVCTPAQALISVPTLVNFSVTTNYPAGNIQPNQTATLIFQARRMR